MKYKTNSILVIGTILAYVAYSVASYTPEEIIISSPNYTPERVLEKDIPDSPELTPEEKVEVQEDIKKSHKHIEKTLDIKKKSVEQMRNDVHKILDEIIEEDSSVVISFNMSYELK
tara:strand:+ start:884 stop:1231 length:348 start_codon:yes stop_codon:yes gene_type:complete